MPINPCGMGMDLLRSCYQTQMRFWRDSDVGAKVQWFFCEEDAQIFPEHHLFGSGNWAADKDDWPGPGEVLGAPRTWVDGSIPGNLDGDKFAGPLRAFREGAVQGDPPLNADEFGICCACSCTCLCVDLMGRFEDEIIMQIDGVSAGATIGRVGDLFRFQKNNAYFPPIWEGPVIQTPGGVFPSVKLYLHCLQAPPPEIEYGVWLHQSGPPYDPETGGDYNLFTVLCDGFYKGTREGFPIGGESTGGETWDVRVIATYREGAT